MDRPRFPAAKASARLALPGLEPPALIFVKAVTGVFTTLGLGAAFGSPYALPDWLCNPCMHPAQPVSRSGPDGDASARRNAGLSGGDELTTRIVLVGPSDGGLNRSAAFDG